MRQRPCGDDTVRPQHVNEKFVRRPTRVHNTRSDTSVARTLSLGVRRKLIMPFVTSGKPNMNLPELVRALVDYDNDARAAPSDRAP